LTLDAGQGGPVAQDTRNAPAAKTGVNGDDANSASAPGGGPADARADAGGASPQTRTDPDNAVPAQDLAATAATAPADSGRAIARTLALAAASSSVAHNPLCPLCFQALLAPILSAISASQ
jgi:hypothetical protein